MRWAIVWIVLLGLGSGCQKARPVDPPVIERDALTVTSERVENSKSGAQDLTFSGTLRPAQRTQISFLRAGRLEQVLVDDGGQVIQGQLLARLDQRSLAARRQELEAQLAEAQAGLNELRADPRPYEEATLTNQVREIESNLGLVQTKLQRRRVLFAEGAVPKEEVDELESQQSALQSQLLAARNRVRDLQAGSRPESRQQGAARVQQVKAALDSLAVEVADSDLLAPYDATVSKRLLDEGTIVQAGQPVMELLTSDRLEAELNLPPERAKALSVGEKLKVTAGAGAYQARVWKILPQVDTASGTQPVLLQLAGSAGLKSGQLIRLTLPGQDREDGYWLPSAALLPGERGLFTCYTLTPVDSIPHLYTVTKQAVEVISTDGARTFVRGTLSGNPEVITQGIQRVVPGQKVRKS